MTDEQIAALRYRLTGQPPPPALITLPLTDYSALIRLLGRTEGLLLCAGLGMVQLGAAEWGRALTVEADRVGKAAAAITTHQA